MQEVLPPENIVIRKDSPAAWVYRICLFVGLAVMGGLGYRISESILSRLDGLFGVVAKVDQLAKDQAEVKVIVDQLARDRAGYAAAADLQGLTGRVDKLTGRVDAIEPLLNSLVAPVERPRPAK
ncbi:hypothetical protein FFK22_026695 [Mycobacterium sp. KBS0706]|uniref:hypothetical protein n=1 Tax=Mycobacterium sp. KBS0706 TaxID=2578109 RepID=UPI00110F77E3|nr:hypothetical protein [Mycobacterium sp. KBS0706]TSD85636.1 hypothetical protein FFK22_026695 [Mycobacterium sp. KBS0706]